MDLATAMKLLILRNIRDQGFRAACNNTHDAPAAVWCRQMGYLTHSNTLTESGKQAIVDFEVVWNRDKNKDTKENKP